MLQADIITASIGSVGGFAADAWAEVASRIVDKGIVVTIANGNAGAAGPLFSSTGSSGKNVLGVASVEASSFPASPFTATFTTHNVSNTTTLGYLPATYNFPINVID